MFLFSDSQSVKITIAADGNSNTGATGYDATGNGETVRYTMARQIWMEKHMAAVDGEYSSFCL